MIITKGSLTGNLVIKQSIQGKINKAIEYIEIYPETQSKTVTPTEQTQTILPDENIYALSQVTVNPIPNNYIEPQGQKEITENGISDVTQYESVNVNVPTPIPNLQNKSIIITENQTQTIVADTGYDGLDEVEITTNVSGGGGDITHEEYLEDVELARSILEDFVPYIEVEYIESDGNQYIDTGYFPTQNTKIDMVMESIDWESFKSPFGVRTPISVSGGWVYTNRFAVWLYTNNRIYFQINTSSESFDFTKAYTDTKFHLIAKNGYFYIKDLTNDYEAEEHTFPKVEGNFTTDFSLPLGALRQAQAIATSNLFKFKLYSCKIYENDILVKDLIPVINRINKKVCLYDKVNKTFLYKSGTGSMTAGGVV